MPNQNEQQRAVSASLRAVLNEYAATREGFLVAPPKTAFLLTAPGKPTIEQGADIALLGSDHAANFDTDSKVWRVAPDLAVEVASVGQKKATLTDKAHAWLRAGTKLVWIVWPEAKTVVVWRNRFTPPESLTSGDTLADDSVLPGFSYPIADLF